MSINPGSAAAFRIPGREPVVTECTSLSCELGSVATEPAAITVLVVVGVVAFVAFAYIRDARADARRERRRVLDERDAFEQFADRVATFDPAPVESSATAFDGGGAGAYQIDNASGTGSRGDVKLRRVLAAYRDTVMSLPHYRNEYDETIPESLAAELGPDTAVSLAANGTLSSGAQSALVSRSRRAATARSSLADAIGTEIDALAGFEQDLTRVDRRRRRLNEHLDGIDGDGTDAAIDVWERLDGLESDCDEIAAGRQASLDDPPMTPEAGGIPDENRAFYEYLYASTDGPRYPVLAQIAEVAGEVHTDRDRVARRIANGG